MTTAIVVYDPWYGFTKSIAAEVARGLSEGGRVATVVADLRDVPVDHLLEHEIIVIGSPHRPGGPSPELCRLMENLRSFDLRGRRFAFFDTSPGRSRGRTVAKMESMLGDLNPFVSQPFLGLSVAVHGSRGSILPGEISHCRDFGRSIRESLSIPA
jgi:flavorubredoxin